MVQNHIIFIHLFQTCLKLWILYYWSLGFCCFFFFLKKIMSQMSWIKQGKSLSRKTLGLSLNVCIISCDIYIIICLFFVKLEYYYFSVESASRKWAATITRDSADSFTNPLTRSNKYSKWFNRKVLGGLMFCPGFLFAGVIFFCFAFFFLINQILG